MDSIVYLVTDIKTMTFKKIKRLLPKLFLLIALNCQWLASKQKKVQSADKQQRKWYFS